MTNENKPPMFPSFVIDPASYEPRSGESFWIARTDLADLQVASADTTQAVPANAKTKIVLRQDEAGQ